MPPKLIQSLPPSKIKRICGACNEEIRGTDIAKHYRTKTDFKILKNLKSFSRERAKKELKNVDCHTAFMFIISNYYDIITHFSAAPYCVWSGSISQDVCLCVSVCLFLSSFIIDYDNFITISRS